MSEKDTLPMADGKTELESTSKTDQIPKEESKEVPEEVSNKPKPAEDEHGVNEIEESNAEDAEDEGNKDRHVIEVKDYHALTMEDLIIELNSLVEKEKVQAIRSHVDKIKKEFNDKFRHFIDEKKDEFISQGGNPIDFHFSSPLKKQFKNAYSEYKTKLRTHYKNIESTLKENLEKKLEIIEELKGLINIEENINTTYKHFKELQEKWRNTGPIPRDKYNNAWNTYHHHVEIFYDFLHLNRDLRDLDFKHNLEQKLKIVEKAEELAQEEDVNRAFRELQVLHKMWKEELGPVAIEYREEIWEKFKIATKTIHKKRQEYFHKLDEVYEKNLGKKEEIITKILAIAEDDTSNHKAWQNKIKEIEALRDSFFKAGKVPLKVNEATWQKFKEAVRSFNRKKNSFYKDLKKEQYKNLEKKLELIKVAEDNKDSDDFETITPLMKKIQAEWKKIGHVPRKDSDKIWKQFKTACNHYFDKLHSQRDSENKIENEAFDKKKIFLEELEKIELTAKQKDNIKLVKEKIEEWKSIGRVPFNKRFIEKKFNRSLDNLFKKLNLNKSEAELIRYDNKLESLSNHQDTKKLDNELFFIKKRVDEAKHEINQLENNLLFFSHVDDDNPVVQEVHKNIARHKEQLKVWKEKLKKIKSLY
ncbi:MAG: DUF349 domain-containing protein [Bacteroidia bacterium]|nr:DUF349 domain-containing protein [Bacteroidia bacterium]